MARMASLIVLIGTVMLFGFLSFEVLSSFLLPMFIAVLLVVTFRPLHLWFKARLKHHDRLAAGLTTLSILVIVLLPMTWILIMAAIELAGLATPLAGRDLAEVVNQVQKRLNLELPPASISKNLDSVRGTLLRLRRADVHDNADELVDLRQWLSDLQKGMEPLNADQQVGREGDGHRVRREAMLTAFDELQTRIAAVELASQRWREADAKGGGGVLQPNDQVDDTPSQSRQEFQNSVADALSAVESFQNVLFGGPIMEWIKKQIAANMPDLVDSLPQKITAWAGPLAVSAPQFVGGVLFEAFVGALIMIVAIYYFFADGAGMIDAVLRLTPLDQKYQRQLLGEFDTLSRAVILAMLLAAFAQGLLAGVGYWFCGFSSIFLLTVVTMLFAMVPFVGGAMIWGGCCLWLFLVDGDPYKALGLAIYCIVVVSTADNVIKPYVLHGRSNLHPLLGLLSVLGGAKALGPIGLVVGPMIVAFLHTLLVMLRSELASIDSRRQVGGGSVIALAAEGVPEITADADGLSKSQDSGGAGGIVIP